MTAVRDRRQEVIDRCVELFNGVTIGLKGGPNGPTAIAPGNFVHNRNELQADKVPGIIFLDADEVRDARQMLPKPGVQQLRMPFQVMKMTPELYVVLDVRGVTNENVGEDLNTARLAILDLLMHDTVLQTIVGSNGDISYDGAVTDLARNRSMKGQMGLSFTFTYPLIIAATAG